MRKKRREDPNKNRRGKAKTLPTKQKKNKLYGGSILHKQNIKTKKKKTVNPEIRRPLWRDEKDYDDRHDKGMRAL